jgi:hypothetical protein
VGPAATASLLDPDALALGTLVVGVVADADELGDGAAVGLAAPGVGVVPGVAPGAPVAPAAPLATGGAVVRPDGACGVDLGVLGAVVAVRGVGFGAAVVGFGVAVVGLGADTVAGAVLGAVPEPNRKPTDEPGLGFQPLRPTWL